MAVKTNAGKESICINLKTAEGQAILHELAVDADVLIHNFRGEVPDKLGIGYEQLRAINPDLIWAVVNGYGPHGPGAKRPATHPVMGACYRRRCAASRRGAHSRLSDLGRRARELAADHGRERSEP